MYYQSEPVTMWFDRRLVMRRSPVHGTGTFATHPIREGEQLMWVTGGIVYSTEDWRTGRVQLDGEQYNEHQLDDDLFLATPKSLFYYVNHSCDPSMLNDVAFRDIAPGEEITTDYAYCEASPAYLLDGCRCGSPRCRRRVTGNDWRLPDLQARYRGFFSPHIERLIRKMQASGGA